MVGLLVGKGLALSADKPLIAVNHLEGHALSPRLVDRDARLSLSAAACQRRPLPVARSARGRRLSPARDHHRRCRGRGVRQGGQAARPGLSRRPGDRGAGHGRRSQGSAAAAPAGRDQGTPFQLRRPQGARCSARSPAANIARRISPPASSRRWSTASSTAPGARWSVAMRRAWSSPAGSPPIGRSARRSSSWRRSTAAASRCRRAGCAPTMRR